MRLQLRTYTIQPGQLEAFIAEWRTQLKPLREQFGFQVLEAYTVPAEDLFVWVMAHESGDAWEAADRAYFASDGRKALEPDPARFIVKMENRFLEPVDL